MYLLTTRLEVDAVEVERELARDDLGGQRLARPARPGEQRGDAEAPQTRVRRSPTRRRRARAGGRARRFRAASTPAHRAARCRPSRRRVSMRCAHASSGRRVSARHASQSNERRFGSPVTVCAVGGERRARTHRTTRAIEVRYVERELGDDRFEMPVERGGKRPQRVLPQRALLGRTGPVYLENDRRPRRQTQSLFTAYEQQPLNPLGESAHGLALLRSVKTNDKPAAEQDRFTLPQAREHVSLGARRRDVGGVQGVQPQAELAAHGGGQCALAPARIAAQLDDLPLAGVSIARLKLLDDALGVRAVGDG